MTKYYAPEIGDKIEGIEASIAEIVRYSHAGQVWYVRCTDGTIYTIENTIYDPGPVKFRLV